MQTQLPLFSNTEKVIPPYQISNSGSFVKNMTLPIHRWFRYSAGFSATWVNDVLQKWNINSTETVLDPFVGSGTVPIVCDTLGIQSIGVEAHPFVARICMAKLLWTTDPDKLELFAMKVLKYSKEKQPEISHYPQLIQRSYETDALRSLDSLKSAWLMLKDNSPESELVWLALTAILRPTAKAGTAQWQYILPNKIKSKTIDPRIAFQQQIANMKLDLRLIQIKATQPHSKIILGDARKIGVSITQKIDAVITSPPYANNYDYADALRFEMTFWGDVNGWGDLHDAVRRYLIVSSSQHASHEKLKIEDLLQLEVIQPIGDELKIVMNQLASERENHGGKKHYHTMIGAYFRDIGSVLQQLRIVCKDGAHMCWVVGDSAPYGVYCPVDEWIAKLALAAGFKDYHFEKLRDRNTKWKNRKHQVPLKEGLLWIEG